MLLFMLLCFLLFYLFISYRNIFNDKKESKIFKKNSVTISLNYYNKNTNTNNFDLNDVDINSIKFFSYLFLVDTEKNNIDTKIIIIYYLLFYKKKLKA